MILRLPQTKRRRRSNVTWDVAVHVMLNKKLQYQPEAHLGEKGWLPKDIDILSRES